MTVATRHLGRTASPPARPTAGIVAPRWRRALPVLVACADLVAAIVAVTLALRLRFGDQPPELHLGGGVVGYGPAAVALVVAWPGVLAALGAYRSVVVGTGPEEMGRVVEAGVTLFAALAAVHLLLDTNLSGRLVALVVTLLTLTTLAVRVLTNRVVHHARLQNRWRHRAVIYGSDTETSALAREFAQPALGVDVVGTCLTDGRGARSGGTGRRPAAATAGDAALHAMSSTGADLLAVAGGTSPAEVRALAWALEGTGAELLIAPAVPDLARQRVVVQPVGGVVLLRVEECRQRRGRLCVKSVVDRVGALLLLVTLAPVVLAVAVAVKMTGPGPVLYRQRRVGRHGAIFQFLKFRTMTAGADAQVAALADHNESDGLLFKLHDDPRVTDVGRFLRRMSLDELPQLWNVIRGDMSLVGPRPLPVRADAFVGDERRRLRVKPGITGLWQVSGRADLGWAETVALDMHYVDHWSLGLDLAIMVRTPLTVLRGRGAY
jgi:exopolysaccharide biosynthesis polyprenyl glycosylphosphotransferase